MIVVEATVSRTKHHETTTSLLVVIINGLAGEDLHMENAARFSVQGCTNHEKMTTHYLNGNVINNTLGGPDDCCTLRKMGY